MEVRLRFGIVNPEKDNVTVEDQVDVVLNPMMAVKLLKLLSSVIDRQYEGLKSLVEAKIEDEDGESAK